MITPFDNAAVPTPSAEGNFSGTRGGHDLPAGSAGLVQSPYDDPQIRTAGPKETPGTIPNQPTIDSFTGDQPPGWQDVSSYESNRSWPASKAQNG